MLKREPLIASLSQRLQDCPTLLAFGLGGSDASGRSDDRSDIDLLIVCADGAVEQSAAAIERAVQSISPIAINFRMPEPVWHGFPQAFYQLADASEDLMIDWVLVERSRHNPWVERQRHGVIKPLFDPHGLLKPVDADITALHTAAAKRVAEIRVKFKLFRHLPIKLAHRGKGPDAAYFYQALVLRPLVDLARCLHCPERHDFGFRYLERDLPAVIFAEIARLSYPPSLETIPDMVRDVSALVEQTLGEWDRLNPPVAKA